MAKTIEIEVKVDNKDAVDNVDKLNDGLEKTGQTAEKSVGGVKKLGTSFGSLVKSLGIIGLIVTAFEVLKEALQKNQKVMDAVNIATTALGIVFNDLFNFISNNLTPAIESISNAFADLPGTFDRIKEAIVNNLEVRFNALIDTFGLLGDAIKKVFSGDFTGALEDAKNAGKEVIDVYTGVENTVDKVSDGIDNLVEATIAYTNSVIDNSKAIIFNKQQAELLELQQTRIREASDRDAERQRQIRDDFTKSFAERIAANEELGRILEEQEIREKKTITDRIGALQAEQNQLGANFERRKEIFALNTELIAVEAQQEGFRSEQQANRIALEKEEAEAKQAKLDAAKEAAEKELETAEKDSNDKVKAQEKADKEEIARLKAVEEAKAEIRGAALDNVGNIFKSLASMDEKNKALQAASLIADNAIGIAKTIQSTIVANAKAVAAFPVTAGQPFVTINTASAALGIGSSIAATAKGLAALKKGGSAGSKPSFGGGGGGGSASTSGLSEDALFSRGSLEAPDSETVGGTAGINQQPVQAIVLESDITNTQNRINNYQERSEIG